MKNSPDIMYKCLLLCISDTATDHPPNSGCFSNTEASRVEVTGWKIKFGEDERGSPSPLPIKEGEVKKKVFHFVKG